MGKDSGGVHSEGSVGGPIAEEGVLGDGLPRATEAGVSAVGGCSDLGEGARAMTVRWSLEAREATRGEGGDADGRRAGSEVCPGVGVSPTEPEKGGASILDIIGARGSDEGTCKVGLEGELGMRERDLEG